MHIKLVSSQSKAIKFTFPDNYENNNFANDHANS